MKLKAVLIANAVLLALLSFPRSACADGCALPELRMALPTMPVQRALIRYRDGRETLVIEPTIDGEGSRFGWIIPLPSVPKHYEKLSPGLLKTLSFQLQPKIKHQTIEEEDLALLAFLLFLLVVVPCSVGLMWGALQGVFVFIGLASLMCWIIPNFIAYRSGSSATMIIKPSVVIENRQTIGSYEIFVLQAQTSVDLNTWLRENDLSLLPQKALPIIDDYIDRKWVFIAARLVSTAEGVSTPHPLLLAFDTGKPVYPMRLTGLNAVNLLLELFVIADHEASPVGYKLEKEYCNVFETQSIQEYDDAYKVGIKSVFEERKRFELYARRIGHKDADKLMWDTCVVTKLVGKIGGLKMKRDMLINFQPTFPFRAVRYSYEGAFESAFLLAYSIFIIGFVFVTIFYSERSTFRTKRPNHPAPSFFKMLSTLIMVCFIVGLWVYMNTGEKIEVNTFYSKLESEWKTFRSHAADVFRAEDVTEFTDDELLTLFENNDLRNPFTLEPVILEDSPGNITVERENGQIIKVNFFRRDGIPGGY